MAPDAYFSSLLAASGAVPVAFQSADLVAHARDRGVDALTLHEARAIQPPALLVVVTRRDLTRVEIGRMFPSSRVMFLNQALYDGSPAATRYTLDQFLATDWLAVVRAQRVAGERMREHLPEWRIVGPGTDLTCTVRDLEPCARNLGIEDPVVDVDLPRGAVMYFEAFIGSMTPDDDQRAFCVDGVGTVAGAIAAISDPAVADARAAGALEMVAMLADSGATAVFDDNRLVSLELDGRDLAPRIAELAGGGYGKAVTECGMGINAGLVEPIAYRFNSAMHEGVPGVHLGIGGIPSGCHFDLLCPGAELVTGPPGSEERPD